MSDDISTTILPPAVREGDLVAVVAPAFQVVPARFRAGVEKLSRRLRLRVPDDILRSDRYFAGSDEIRAAELDAAIRDPDVRAIVCARGGYGIARILPMLDPAALRADPKPIVGFSDATALLAWAERAGVRGIHGPVVSQLVDIPDDDLDTLVRALTDPTPLGALPWPLAPLGARLGARLAAPVTGRLVAGNLTLLTNLVATPWQIPLRDSILLFEEIGEKPYALDRYLTHLHQSRALDGALAAVVGDLTRCTDPRVDSTSPDDPEPAFFSVAERLAAFGLSGYRGAPVGHGTRNFAVPFGGNATLSPDGSLIVHTAAVS